MGKVLWQALPLSPWDKAGAPDFWPRLREGALRLRADTDRAIMVSVGCNLFEWGTWLRRLDNFLVDIMIEPDRVESLPRRPLERHLAALAKVCEYLGDVADVVRFCDDLGTDRRPLHGPARSTGGCSSRATAGSASTPTPTRACTRSSTPAARSTRFLPDLIEVGIEVVNPVQTNAAAWSPSG